MRVLFMGTPKFALPSLEKIYRHFELIGVVCQPDRPAGRGMRPQPPPTKVFALERHLPVYQPATSRELEDVVLSLKPQCVVVVAYGKILSSKILSAVPYGCVNLHASLLPKYRGAAPIQRALMAGEKNTGITVMLMDEGMDTGDILAQETVSIEEEDNLETLSEKLSHKGADLLLQTLQRWFRGEIEPVPQKGEPTYAPPIQKEEFRICWKATSESVKDRVRGLYPNAYTLTPEGHRIRILKVRPVEGTGEPGEILSRNRLVVACSKGAVEIQELITPKGKRVRGEDFLKGYSLKNFL
ncbi:methionyl-tRNA formyltransferase [Thermocrinis albus DSM 14484]|uniref:Methionyl-tRNA formyltransferase n=1 Tax=Thermocrinis albus (strain DSM 14484 / JCM 11386 / HI 11/12) TaxID=638303 RepID=D3SL74_THEAH|nr:methionyl-tRNA formyltransferase [Thermocrinis albus]ADC89504.1 methionyl-tRNA formyltransferase [Thermocrinis albus DSM 14484]